MIKNKKTGQMYVGQSIDIERRWQEHYRGQDKTASYIDNAINKHKKSNFILNIIYKAEEDNELLNEMEKYYIWKYNTYKDKNHYNLTPGGDFNPMHVKDLQTKVSKSLQGRDKSLSHKINLSKSSNSSGVFRTYIRIDKRIEQGFRWTYQCWENNKKKSISSTKLKDLKNKVINAGLEWKILDKNKALYYKSKEKEYKKYTLWDNKKCHYFKSDMMKDNTKLNPRKCFGFRYNTKHIKIGKFIDFYTPELLFKLTEEFRVS